MKRNNILKYLILGIVIILLVSLISFCVKPGDTELPKNEVKVEEIVEPSTNMNEILSGSFEGEEALEVEGFEKENEDWVSGSSTAEEDDFVVGAKQDSPIYYSQIDNRWKNHPYTITGSKTQTIGSSGCGPTSAAMIVSSIKGTVLPDQMGDLYVSHGYRTANNGTYWSAFTWTAKYFDIEYKQASSVDGMIDLLKQNYYCIVSCSNGLFSTGGHYIVVYGIDGDTLKIFDPYLYNGKFNNYGRAGKVTVSGNTVYCSVANFKAYGNTKFYFGFKNELPKLDNYTVGQRVLVDVPVTVAFNGGDKSIVDDGVIQFWIHNSVITTDNRVYGLADVAYDGGDRDIVQIFDDQFWCSEENMSLYTQTATITQPTKPAEKEEVKKEETKQEQKPATTKYVRGRYKVTGASKLNVRAGAGTKYKVKKQYNKNTVFDTYEIKGNWARTPSGWVSLNYCSLMYKY